jgi:hypothetical protein
MTTTELPPIGATTLRCADLRGGLETMQSCLYCNGYGFTDYSGPAKARILRSKAGTEYQVVKDGQIIAVEWKSPAKRRRPAPVALGARFSVNPH